jgi:hypothetical protein
MIAVDTNILVYAHRAEMPFHTAAFACLKSLAEGRSAWGIPVSCVHEFLAIVTNPKVFKPASRVDQALAQIDAWLDAPHARLLHSGAQHWPILSTLVSKARLQGDNFTMHALPPFASKTACPCSTPLTETLVASKTSKQSTHWFNHVPHAHFPACSTRRLHRARVLDRHR